MVDVIASTVGEHCIDKMGFYIRWLRTFTREAARIMARVLVVKIPPDFAAIHKGIDQHTRREHRVRVGRTT